MSGALADSSSGRMGARAATDHGIGLVVPADWWVVPLADEAARARVIAAMVDQQIGPVDQNATLRRQLRTEVGASARRAAASGGWALAFMLTRAGRTRCRRP